MKPRELLRAAARYVRDNPSALVKAAADATSLRFGVLHRRAALGGRTGHAEQEGRRRTSRSAVPAGAPSNT